MPAALLPRLLGCEAAADRPLADDEERALAVLDGLLARPLAGDSLPRAAALIPQLLAMLRQAELPVAELAQRVARDPVLSAEVLRLASSARYRAQGTVGDLGQAVMVIGEAGLKAAIARVVLKPIYEAAPGAASARAAARQWEHAEALAEAAAAAAREAGLAPFDGYLAGLLHGAGWTIALRAVDRARIELPLPPSQAFADALDRRAHRLFGMAAQQWSITPGFRALADDAAAVPLAESREPLACALRRALASVVGVRPGS